MSSNEPNMDLIVKAIKVYVKENLEYVDKTNGQSVGVGSRERIQEESN